MAARTRISSGQYDAARQFAFNIQVKLLNPSLLEVEILRLNGPCERGWIRRLSKDWRESLGHVLAELEGEYGTSAGSRLRCAASDSKGKGVSLCEERRILPQSLRTLIPGGIVKHRIAGAYGCSCASERFPCQSNAGLESGLVKLNANPSV